MTVPRFEAPEVLVGAEARHNQAWAEVNTRIHIRQTVALTYSTIAWTVVAYVLSRPADAPSNGIDWVGFALPGLGLVAALWTVHNDRIIGLLSVYCATLQCWPSDRGVPPLPSWHDPKQGWIKRALSYRRLSDCAFILVLVASMIPGVREMASRSAQSQLAGAAIVVGIVLGLLAAVIVASNWRFREHTLPRFGYRWVEDKWQFTDGAGVNYSEVFPR